MATKRAPRTTASATKKPAAVITRATALALLVAGLALSAYNLALMTAKTGSLYGITDSWMTLKENYAMTGTGEPIPEPVIEDLKPAPIVLSSVVAYRDGEEALLQENLVAPVLSYYEVAEGPYPKALLIERKNAGSRDVNVRLFFSDGVETAHLWPSTNAVDGRWVPPCAPTLEEVTEAAPLCPARFRTMEEPTY